MHNLIERQKGLSPYCRAYRAQYFLYDRSAVLAISTSSHAPLILAHICATQVSCCLKSNIAKSPSCSQWNANYGSSFPWSPKMAMWRTWRGNLCFCIYRSNFKAFRIQQCSISQWAEAVWTSFADSKPDIGGVCTVGSYYILLCCRAFGLFFKASPCGSAQGWWVASESLPSIDQERIVLPGITALSSLKNSMSMFDKALVNSAVTLWSLMKPPFLLSCGQNRYFCAVTCRNMAWQQWENSSRAGFCSAYSIWGCFMHR